MISKQLQKLIRSLEIKKYRDQENLFLGEGPKVVSELIEGFKCRLLVATKEFVDASGSRSLEMAENVEVVSTSELERLSLLKTPQKVLGLFEKKSFSQFDAEAAKKDLCLALDSVQDPGNLGTIIRLANWFGIKHILCSTTTADVYSPKVIQATMGGICNTNVYYTSLPDVLASLSKNMPIYGTFLEGENIYHTELCQNGVIVMGNEGRGISHEVAQLVTKKLFIPPYHTDAQTVESLNVSVATAITCAEFRRRI